MQQTLHYNSDGSVSSKNGLFDACIEMPSSFQYIAAASKETAMIDANNLMANIVMDLSSFRVVSAVHVYVITPFVK